jgi:hypothetical protein
MPRKPGKIEAAQIEEAERQLVEPDPEAHAGELLAGGWSRRARTWFSRGLDLWTVRFERLGKFFKNVAFALGGIAAIIALIKQLRTRNVAPAELPKGSGSASTFADRVDKPSPPKP